MNIANVRLLSQQLAAPLFTAPAEVVGWFGFMQGQDLRMMRWAVAMRTKRPSLRAFQKAYDGGTIVRMHLFRCTWQITAAADVRPWLALCADKSRRALLGFMKTTGRAVSQKDYERFAAALPAVLKGRASTTKDDLLRMLDGSGCHVQEPRMYLRFAEYDGILCSGHLHPSQATYALLGERIPQEKDGHTSREETLARLARAYFRSHSPATLDDFIWWTGLGTAECRAAVRELADELEQAEQGGQTFYIHADCRTRGCRNTAILLPPYDEYLIGYKSRHIVLAEEHKHRAHNGNGIFHPVIVSGGRVTGNWSPGKPGAEFFLPGYETDMEAAYARYNNFLNA